MTQWMLPPKQLKWAKSLEQKYISPRKKCLVSGSSFTVGTNQTNVAASWPGYVYERCALEEVIDLSYPAMNNHYIGESVIDWLQTTSLKEKNDFFAVVMWNGIFNNMGKNIEVNVWPTINEKIYTPDYRSVKNNIFANVNQNFEIICRTGDFLKSNYIPYAFTFYANILFPPLLPTEDGLIKFYKNLSNDNITKIQRYNLIPTLKESYLYDYTFFTDQFDTDGYHPNINARLSWTDQVLLPELVQLGILTNN